MADEEKPPIEKLVYIFQSHHVGFYKQGGLMVVELSMMQIAPQFSSSPSAARIFSRSFRQCSSSHSGI